MKTVYSFDPLSRIYVGPVTLDDSDLSPQEPGIYLVPGNCLEAAPPAVPEGIVSVAGVADWSLQPVPEVVPTPAPPVRAVTMRQARLALLAAGKLSQVGAAIAQLASPQREAAEIEWEFAGTVERQSVLVDLLAVSLGLDTSQLDQIFQEAAAL